MSVDFAAAQKLFVSIPKLDQTKIDKMKQECAEIRDTLRQHPVLKRFYAEDSPSNTKPEHAFGARLDAALKCARCALGEIETITNEDRPEIRLIQADRATRLILMSEVFLWRDQIEKIADASPLPQHTVSRNVMPWPLMFWSREFAHVSPDEQMQTTWIAALLDERKTPQGAGGMMIVSDIYNEQLKTGKLMFGYFNFGKLWPADYGNEHSIGMILRRCAFLNSPFITTERRKLPHWMRRQGQRTGLIKSSSQEANEEMHIVRLRHVQHEKKDQTPTEGREIAWKHQWWVKAHYRAQWYPSEEAHRVIWIEPFLKGPQGAPILEKLYDVSR